VVVRRKAKPLLYTIIISFIGMMLLAFGIVCIYLASPVDRKDDTTIEVEISNGTGVKRIAKILKEKELIKSEFYFSVYVKLYGNKTLKASTYKFTKQMSLKKIVKSLEKGSTYDPDAITLTFKEGERITSYIKQISNNTTFSEDEIKNIINNKEYLASLIEEYWFLTEEILNPAIYYPLEGYLAPDTYFFKKDVEIKTIIKTLLDKMESNLEEYRTLFNNQNIHNILTMASIVELEGTNTENRKEIVGVFNNRLNLKMNLGSDVTTYYALQLPMTKDLTSAQFQTNNPYNTRSTQMMGKMPIGPICNPSKSSIEASISPSNNNYIYFVADKNGKIYFTKTLKEHEQKINEIKEKGDWIW